MATYDLGKVVGDAGEKGDDGSTVWNTSTAPTYANSKYTFNISNLSGKTGLQIAVNDIIFYSTYYYIVSTVNSTTVDCSTRVSIKGSDASVTIVDNLTSTSSTSALSAKQGKVLNDNKIETSAIATSFGSTPSDSKVASEKLIKDSLDAKQATLISGTNIKTVNNNSLLGSGNITIEGGSNVDVVTSWEATLSDTKVPSEKLTKNSLDGKAPTAHASSSSTYGLGTTANYGHVKTINGLTQSSHSDGTALSAYQGKVLKDAIDAKPDSSDIPTKTSDLTNDSNYISTSSTSGLIKNDGTIDTTSYSTFSGSYNDLSNKPTIPSASTTTPSADTTSGSYGSGTSYARSNHTHPKSSLYAEATHSHTKSQITDFPSIPSKTSDLTNDGADGTNVFVANNDSRLSDARTPTAHTHGQITADGSNTSTAVTIASDDKILITDTSDSSKIKRVNGLLASHISDSTAHSNIGSSANATQASINTSIDTALSGKQATLVSGTNLKTINNNSLLGSGNINIEGGGGSGGSYINDFYGDSSTNELIIDYDTGVSQADIVTSWSSTTSDTNVPSEKLAKDTLDTKIDKSSTTGLVKNDGSIMTSGTGSTNYSAGNHTHSGYVSATKVTSWSSTPSDSNVPSEKLVADSLGGIEDLIGDAITYINQ